MKIILSFILALTSCLGFAQMPQNLEQEVVTLKKQIRSLEKEDYQLRNSINKLKRDFRSDLDSLQQHLEEADDQIDSTQQDLNNVNESSSRKIAELDSSMSKKSLYWIIAFLGVALLSVLAYIILGKRIRSERITMEDQISATQKSMEEEAVKLDTKLTEIIESQLKLAQSVKDAAPASNVVEEPDHSLALKVADEIMRINKNLANMDPNTKGLKQLAASVKRIEDNFAANGYEMPELLNKPVTPGLKLIINNTIQDESLNIGEEIITRIIKPQVNYKGVMIQAAQVEVSIGH